MGQILLQMVIAKNIVLEKNTIFLIVFYSFNSSSTLFTLLTIFVKDMKASWSPIFIYGPCCVYLHICKQVDLIIEDLNVVFVPTMDQIQIQIIMIWCSLCILSFKFSFQRRLFGSNRYTFSFLSNVRVANVVADHNDLLTQWRPI
jgi:hypothetical protein